MQHTWDLTDNFIRQPPFPKFVQFETSTICNAQCTFCPQNHMKRKGQVGTWRTILKVIDEAVPHASSCCPFLYQEPLVEPRLMALLDNIKQVNRHCQTVVYSNMAAMTTKLAKQIIESRLLDELHISFYGPTKQIYNKIQPPLNYEQTKRRIRNFMKQRDESGDFKPEVTMHYIVAPPLLEHNYSFVCEWESVVDNVAFVHYDDFHGTMPSLSETYEDTFWGAPAKVRTPCIRLWNGLNILCDGTVIPCCVDYNGEISLGNVNDNLLENIWVGEPFSHLRQLHVDRKFNKIPLCRHCKIWRHQHPMEWNNIWQETLIAK